MGLQSVRRLGRQQPLQVILDAGGGHVGIVQLPLLPGGQPTPQALSCRTSEGGLAQDLPGEEGAGIQPGKVREIGEEETPGFRFRMAMGTDGQVLPSRRILPWGKLAVQKLLDLLRG